MGTLTCHDDWYGSKGPDVWSGGGLRSRRSWRCRLFEYKYRHRQMWQTQGEAFWWGLTASMFLRLIGLAMSKFLKVRNFLSPFDNCSPEFLISAQHEQICLFIQTHHQWLAVFSSKTIQADLQCRHSFNYSRYVSSNLSTLSSAWWLLQIITSELSMTY